MSLKILSGLTAGQVLQRRGARGAEVTVLGTGEGDAPLQATLLKGDAPVKGWSRRKAGRIARGKFRVKLAGLPAGGPYRLRLEAGGQRAELAPFFVGDVWLLAGQSNMEGVGNMTGAAKPHPLIMAFSMRREWRLAEDPLHILDESPDECHAATQCTVEAGERLRRTKPKGVGAGLFFAREMLARSGGVPQGLICAARGGTSMQQWAPERKRLGGASLFASMLASVAATGQPVAGVLWYQGESDANRQDAPHYTRRMRRLVAATRRELRQPRLPWVIVQIGGFASDMTEWPAWNNIQEQQRLLPQKIGFLETVAAIDLPLDDLIHIGAKGFSRLGVRLARVADRLVYGNRAEAPPPRLRHARWVEAPPFSHIEVAFDNVPGGLRSNGEPHGFSVANAAGGLVNLVYKTELSGDKAQVYLTRKPESGEWLHYGLGYLPVCSITDGRDFALPVAGPLAMANVKPRAVTAFLTRWMVTPVVPAAKPLDQVTLEEAKAVAAVERDYPGGGMVSEHERWDGKSGQAFFRARIELSEPMKLDFLLGYDGPFRIWLDGAPFYLDMAGINPCITDAHSHPASLAAGTHEIVVGMDLNGGKAWGFILRFARRDTTPVQRKSGNFVKPGFTL